MKVFISSRRAVPISFSIQTNFDPICLIRNYIPVLSLNDVVSSDGQLLYDFSYSFNIVERGPSGSIIMYHREETQFRSIFGIS